MRTSKILATAAAVLGLSLIGGPAIAAAPAPAAQVVTPAASPISVDKPVVASGDTLTITVNHGPEAMTHVASEAFAGKGANPDDPARGYARFVSDANGVATYTAVVDVPAGDYAVDARIGGGNAEDTFITVQ